MPRDLGRLLTFVPRSCRTEFIEIFHDSITERRTLYCRKNFFEYVFIRIPAVKSIKIISPFKTNDMRLNRNKLERVICKTSRQYQNVHLYTFAVNVFKYFVNWGPRLVFLNMTFRNEFIAESRTLLEEFDISQPKNVEFCGVTHETAYILLSRCSSLGSVSLLGFWPMVHNK